MNVEILFVIYIQINIDALLWILYRFGEGNI